MTSTIRKNTRSSIALKRELWYWHISLTHLGFLLTLAWITFGSWPTNGMMITLVLLLLAVAWRMGDRVIMRRWLTSFR